MIFQEEDYTHFFSYEFMKLYRTHWKEIGNFNKQKIPLEPDWDIYRTLGKQGKLITFTIRTPNGLLIGYNIFIVTTHHHYRNAIIAENDILYLHPDYRKGYTGYNFIKYCIKELKERVDIIMLSVKASHSIEAITKRLGFKLMDYKFVLET